MGLKRLSPRAESPITLAQAKQHCRVDHSDDDAIIQLYMEAAVDHIEGNRGVLGYGLVNQAWELTYDAFPSDDLELPLGPVPSVTKVEYADLDTGVMIEWPSTNYQVDASREGWISPINGWPDTSDVINAVKVTFVAGYGPTAADVPADIKMALLHLVSHWYENREAVSDGNMMTVPMTFESLIGAIRKISI
jgi:uncharacterized phiE125 gp8 family phage protein